MGDEIIIHPPSYSALFSFDIFVGHARVISVELEPHLPESPFEQTIP